MEYEDREVFYQKSKKTYHYFMRPKAKFIWPDGREKIIEPVRMRRFSRKTESTFWPLLKGIMQPRMGD